MFVPEISFFGEWKSNTPQTGECMHVASSSPSPRAGCFLPSAALQPELVSPALQSGVKGLSFAPRQQQLAIFRATTAAARGLGSCEAKKQEESRTASCAVAVTVRCSE
eukprot:101326-Rhodomonas_salina.2